MSNTQRLVFSILEFLNSEFTACSVSEEKRESLEVVIECLEKVYDLSLNNPSDRSKFHFDEPLKDIFEKSAKKSPTDEDKRKAEQLKSQGNELMKEGRFTDAIHSYSEAMECDWTNAIYLCNRAAAYTKLDKHEQAIEDCQKALTLDPNYGKAYGRMGSAYMSLQKYQEAKDCYTKAIELDPNIDLYHSKLKEATEHISHQSAENPGGTNLLNSLFSNPGIMNMAHQFMANPQMQQMVSSMMGGFGGMSPGDQPAPQNSNPSSTAEDTSSETRTGDNAPGETTTEGTAPGGTNPSEGAAGYSNIFQFATQMAEQLQQTNPDLVNNLRDTMQQSSPNNSGGDSNKDSEDKSSEGKK